MKVPFIDLHKINARFDIAQKIKDILNSGAYLHGAEVAAFEREFAEYVGAAHCVALANGLDALRITLRAWLTLGELAPGDEVLVPANSFIASALAVTDCGLEVRFLDVDPATYNVDVDIVTREITAKTRVVMPVHLYGRLADVERIRQLCDQKGLLLLEDAAQAHGARSSRSAGSFGDAAAFSFYPTKNLGALGDAGCMVTNDATLAARARAIANYGAPRKYYHEVLGTNSRMDEFQAGVLRLKLKRLEADNERRRTIAQRYTRLIDHPLVRVPLCRSNDRAHVWHIFAVTTPAREDLVDYLSFKGIQTNVHYPCAIPRQPAYAHRRYPQTVNAEALQHQLLSLPISPVMEDEEIQYVIDNINSWPGPAGTRAM